MLLWLFYRKAFCFSVFYRCLFHTFYGQHVISGTRRALRTVGFVSVWRFEVMADAFGDDLFSVFDEEQAGSSKKATPKSAAQAG